MALTQGVKESLWLQELRKDLGALKHKGEIQQTQCDNQGAIALTRNPEYHAWTEHVDIHFHFIRQHVESNTIKLFYCPTHKMTADVFTKALARPQFNKHTVALGLALLSNDMSGKSQQLNLPGKATLAHAGLERIPGEGEC